MSAHTSRAKTYINPDIKQGEHPTFKFERMNFIPENKLVGKPKSDLEDNILQHSLNLTCKMMEDRLRKTHRDIEGSALVLVAGGGG